MGKRHKQKATDLGLYMLRAHTRSVLTRYLYLSLQPARIGTSLSGRAFFGWVSIRPTRNFEHALIFVHDIEKCIGKLSSLDRDILTRIVIQEYTQAEAANLLGMSVRTICYKFPAALDALTEKLIEAELLILPDAA